MSSLIHTDRFIHGHPMQVLLTHRQEQNGLSTFEQWAIKSICDKLLAHYPGHPWAVRVDDAPTVGIAVIYHEYLSQNFGYVKKLHNIKDDPAFRWVVRAGGELLERYNVDRQGYSRGIFADARPVFSDVKLIGHSRAEQYVDALPREQIVAGARPQRTPRVLTEKDV